MVLKVVGVFGIAVLSWVGYNASSLHLSEVSDSPSMFGIALLCAAAVGVFPLLRLMSLTD